MSVVLHGLIIRLFFFFLLQRFREFRARRHAVYPFSPGVFLLCFFFYFL